MLALAEVDKVVRKVASGTLKGAAGIRRVSSARTLDSDGREALHITIVLKRGSAGKVGGDRALDTLVGIDRALRGANEDRFPIVSFATEEELQDERDSDGETES